jgi:hypothetical protein
MSSAGLESVECRACSGGVVDVIVGRHQWSRWSIITRAFLRFIFHSLSGGGWPNEKCRGPNVMMYGTASFSVYVHVVPNYRENNSEKLMILSPSQVQIQEFVVEVIPWFQVGARPARCEFPNPARGSTSVTTRIQYNSMGITETIGRSGQTASRACGR